MAWVKYVPLINCLYVVFYFRESRYLLFLTENYAALRILQQDLLFDAENPPFVLFGSSFPKDREYTQVGCDCCDIFKYTYHVIHTTLAPNIVLLSIIIMHYHHLVIPCIYYCHPIIRNNL